MSCILIGHSIMRNCFSSLVELVLNVIIIYNVFRISLSNMTADVNVGLVLEDDAFSFINPGIEFVHDEVVVKVSVIISA